MTTITAPLAVRMAEPTALGRRGTAALLLTGFLGTYLFSSTNIALPIIADDLGGGAAAGTMVLCAYAATFATSMVFFGRIGDRIGRRRILTVGLLLIIAASLLSGAAASLPILVLARALQGVGAAMAVPQVLSSIQTTTTGAARIRTLSLFAAVSGLGTTAGQVIGGGLLSLDLAHTSWRGVLWFGAVIGVTALAMLPGVPDTRGDRVGVDIGGAVLLTASLVALIIGLDLGPGAGWATWTLGLVALALAGVGAFWWHQSRREDRGVHSLVPPSVLRMMPVRTGLLMALVFFGGFGAYMYAIAQVSQKVVGLAPIVAGAALVPFALAFTAVSLMIGRIQSRLGGWTMPVGAALQLVALLAMAAVQLLVPAASWLGAIQLPGLVLGAAQAMMFGPLVQTVMAGVPDEVAGLTGGLVSTVQQGALALGVALLGQFFVQLETRWSGEIAFAVLCLVQVVLAAMFGLLALRLRRA